MFTVSSDKPYVLYTCKKLQVVMCSFSAQSSQPLGLTKQLKFMDSLKRTLSSYAIPTLSPYNNAPHPAWCFSIPYGHYKLYWIHLSLVFILFILKDEIILFLCSLFLQINFTFFTLAKKLQMILFQLQLTELHSK